MMIINPKKNDTTNRDHEIEGMVSIQWLEVFPDAAREYVLPKLRLLEAEIKQLETQIGKLLRPVETIKDGWFVRECIKAFHVSRLVELRQEYQRLKRYFPQPTRRGFINREHIASAKQYPIVQLAEEHLQNVRRMGKAYRTLCPFHEERRPSFYLFPNTNRFHCFGCQTHGDVIALTKKLLNISFIGAVRHLTKTYDR